MDSCKGTRFRHRGQTQRKITWTARGPTSIYARESRRQLSYVGGKRRPTHRESSELRRLPSRWSLEQCWREAGGHLGIKPPNANCATLHGDGAKPFGPATARMGQ